MIDEHVIPGGHLEILLDRPVAGTLEHQCVRACHHRLTDDADLQQHTIDPQLGVCRAHAELDEADHLVVDRIEDLEKPRRDQDTIDLGVRVGVQ